MAVRLGRGGDLYRRALDAATAGDLASLGQRCRLLLAIADAQIHSFAVAHARPILLEAVRIAREIGDVESIARAALTMEGVSDHLWDATGQQLCQEALAGLPDEDSALRARLMASLVSTSVWDEGDERVLSARALAMAERVGDRRAIREALRSRQLAMSGPDGATERLALGDRLVAFGADGDDDALMWGRLWRFDALAQLGDLDGAESELAPNAAVAERLRSPIAAWHVARCRAAIAGARGRFDEAMTFARDCEDLARRAGTGGPLLPSQAMLVLYRLMTGDPGAFPEEHVPPTANATATAFLSAVHAFWLLATGEREQALRIYRATLAPSAAPPMVRLPALSWMIDFAAEFDDRDSAAEAYRRLLPHADLLVCGGAGIVAIVGTVQQALGLAAATVGRLDVAIRHLRAAIELGERIGMPPAVVSATYQLARVLARRTRPGDHDEASALAASATAMADQLGMTPLAGLAHDLAASLAGHGAGPLTKREAEIAVLVSQDSRTARSPPRPISERTAGTRAASWSARVREPRAGRRVVAAGQPH
jgi:tetratricopeptide (TPR) repeat protein